MLLFVILACLEASVYICNKYLFVNLEAFVCKYYINLDTLFKAFDSVNTTL